MKIARSKASEAVHSPTKTGTPKRKRFSVGRPRKDDSGVVTADRILDAAEDLFSKHGFDGVTMREVAALANVDPALAHYYFSTK
ncbi:MAG: helix-turn-helix transcriptional regulator, partial [Betaproteobacteria bacterium]|nr:helix-turn-helix transcriptional regulator [Betaproteobacteria bacterium]